VREGEFMALYFLAMKNPLLPFSFASLGVQLMKKNKVAFELPAKPGAGNLDRLFKKVAEIEEIS
jgi:heterodisulfide reductase subunit C